MKDGRNESHLSLLLLTIAAIVLLTLDVVVARTTSVRESAPPGINRLHVLTNTFPVHRLSRGDLFGQPRPRMPAARPASDYSDSYEQFRNQRPRTFAPARLDGILMDDPKLLDQLGNTA